MNKLPAALLLSALLLCACAVDNSPDTPDTATAGETTASGVGSEQTSDTTAPPTEEFAGFALTLSSPAVRLIPGEETDIEALLGKPTEKLEAPSCIHAGNDTVYYYDGLEIVTAPSASGSSYILSLTLTSDAYKTEEGIFVGTPFADASAAYGAYDTAKSSPDFGRYVFLKSTTSLTLLTDADDIVTSISYTHEG